MPVPERPKKRAVSPAAPTFAEQCMGSTPRAGSTKLSAVKIDFLISPAYAVPPTSTTRSVKWTTMKAPELVPWRLGSACMEGAW